MLDEGFIKLLKDYINKRCDGGCNSCLLGKTTVYRSDYVWVDMCYAIDSFIGKIRE